MKIGIDMTGVSATDGGLPNGIMSYALQITNHILSVDHDNDYHIYCRNEIPYGLASGSPSASVRIIKSRNRKICQQTQLPLWASYDRVELMFFPYHSASLICPSKSVATIHDLHPYVVPNHFRRIHDLNAAGKAMKSLANRLYWKNILKSACRRVDRIIAVSHSTKRDIERIFKVSKERIDVVHEGVDSRYFNLETDGRNLADFRGEYKLPQRYILCVGTHAYKNIGGALRSFDIVRKAMENPPKLVIAGKKAYLSPDIWEVMRELKLAGDVIFTDFFPDQDLKYLYQCAEVFLFPSFYEGFGLPVLEAFACGTPVVASTAGSLPEVAGDAALLASPHDPEAIAGSLIKVLSDHRLREEKRCLGLQRAHEFSWENAATKTVAIFRELTMMEKS